jgi:hypothetical protein
MIKTLASVIALPLLVFGQPAAPLPKAELTRIYTRAIADFIIDANKHNKTKFDTLFFGKRKNNQPDDFPDIELPVTIEHTQVRLISPEAGQKLQQQLKSRVYVNLIGWANREKADFLFYVFSNGFEHQYNYSINYRYNETTKEFELAKLEVKKPPFDK